MKRLLPFLLVFWLSLASAAPPADIQMDITMEKITGLIKEGKEADALPYFAQLEALNKPLPEAFYFYYIRSLEKAGRSKEALERTTAYFGRYAKKGQYYKEIVAAAGRLSIVVEKQDQATKEAYDKAMATYAQDLARYEKVVQECPRKFHDLVASTRRDFANAEQACNPPNPACSCEHERRWGVNSCNKQKALRTYDRLAEKLDELSASSAYEYCSGRYTAPRKPVAPA